MVKHRPCKELHTHHKPVLPIRTVSKPVHRQIGRYHGHYASPTPRSSTDKIFAGEVFAPLIHQRGEHVAIGAVSRQHEVPLVRRVLQTTSVARRVLALPQMVQLDRLRCRGIQSLHCEEWRSESSGRARSPALSLRLCEDTRCRNRFQERRWWWKSYKREGNREENKLVIMSNFRPWAAHSLCSRVWKKAMNKRRS